MEVIKATTMAEIWRDIPNYEGHYQVSNLGRVKAVFYKNKYGIIPNREKFLKLQNVRGYLRVILSENGIKKQYSVHRLVAEVFIPNSDNKACVNHKDGNKQNNCIDNLEWCTYSENEQHSHTVLGKQPVNKKKVNQYDLQGNYIQQYESLAEASRKLNKVYYPISSCCNGSLKTAYGYKWKFAKESD